MSEKILALDVETATSTRESICSVGVALFENEVVIKQKYWLIQPPNNYYDAMNTDIHGITPHDTKDAMSFRDIWQDLYSYITSSDLIVAHNAAFDISVIRSSLGFYGLSVPRHPYACTYLLSNRLLGRGQAGERRLNSLCAKYKVPLLNHHSADEDSIACGLMAYKMIKDSENKRTYSSITDATKKEGLIKCLSHGGEEPWPVACQIYFEDK